MYSRAPGLPFEPGFFLTCTLAEIRIAITPTSQADICPRRFGGDLVMPVDNLRIPLELKVPVSAVKLEEDFLARSLR